MTPLRKAFLFRAADMTHLPGTSIEFELYSGFMLQVRWGLANKFVKYSDNKKRLVITAKGRIALAKTIETAKQDALRRGWIAEIRRTNGGANVQGH